MVHGRACRRRYGQVSEAIFQTQVFVYEMVEDAYQWIIKSVGDEFIYARYGNPTIVIFEKRSTLSRGAAAAVAAA